MNSYGLFISASPRITDQQIRARAELLSTLIIMRQIAITGVLLLMMFKSPSNTHLIWPVFVGNILAYLISRSKWYMPGSFIVIFEPMVSVPWGMHGNFDHLDAIMSAPMWLTVGPLISSLVLPARYTALAIVGTFLSCFAIYWDYESAYADLLGMQTMGIIAVSTLAMVGAHLRDREARALENERAKLLQSAKLASLGEMAAGVAHELNSPLAAIVLNAELLQEELKTEGEEHKSSFEQARAIAEIAERMGKIILGLRAFARDGRQEPAVVVPARKWIQDCLDLCQQRLHKSGVELQIEDSNFDIACAVQPVQLSQTLLNLLNNSFDAVSKQGEKWIRVEARAINAHLEILVTDSGPGISPAHKARMFEPFFTTKGVGAGTGLGLSISRGILEKHGGELILDESSKHTRFIIRLPLRVSRMAA